MIIVRREGFSNDQWQIDGTNLMNIRYDAGAFSSDPTEIVRPTYCRTPRKWRIVNNRLRGDWRIDNALKALPRDKFDYRLADRCPRHTIPSLTRGMTPVWQGPGSMLYRIDK